MDLKIKRKPMKPTPTYDETSSYEKSWPYEETLSYEETSPPADKHYSWVACLAITCQPSTLSIPVFPILFRLFSKTNWIFFFESQRQCNAGSQKLNCRGWLFIYKCRPTNQNFTIGRRGSKVFLYFLRNRSFCRRLGLVVPYHSNDISLSLSLSVGLSPVP